MLCSVIIPVYQGVKYIRSCVESVLSQTDADLEILVVDDGSTDGTHEVVEDICHCDGRVRYICQSRNMGPAAARNTGIALAAGEWIALIDADDLWEKDKLRLQFELQKKTGADLIYTGVRYFSDPNVSEKTVHVPTATDYERLLKSTDIVCSSVLVRRSLLGDEPFERSDLHEDFILWLRLLKNGCIAAGIDEPLTLHRIHPDAKTASKLKSARMTLRTYKYVGIPFFKRIYCFASYCLKAFMKYFGVRKA